MDIDSDFRIIVNDPLGLLLLFRWLPPRRLWRFWKEGHSAHNRR